MILLKRKRIKHEAQVIDLFQESKYTKQFLKENIEGIVEELSKQFKEPEDCYREIIQNSIDAETPQIDVYFDVEKMEGKQSKFSVIFEDYGIGMDSQDRKDFFLKLFASKKEHDIRKIGQYGIGISSIFALDLEEVFVESSGKPKESGEIESWGLHIKSVSSSPSCAYYNIPERKGTKISLVRIVNTANIEKHKLKVFEKIAYYCERSRTPIYIEKRFVNKEFDLESSIKISQNRSGLEYVLSIGEKNRPFFEIFNNRLKLQDGESLFGSYKDVSCLISSPYFKHTFSRDSVVENDAYKNTINEVRKAISGLFVKSLEVIENYDNTPTPVFDLRAPSVEIWYFSNVKIVNNDFAIAAVERDIELTKEFPESKIFLESLDGVEKKIAELKEKQVSYSKKLKEYNNTLDKRSRELNAAWRFVNLWLKDTVENVKNKRIGRDIRRFFAPSDFYSRLKKILPLATSKYKVIRTLSGDFSISEVSDILKEEDRLYYIHQRNFRLEDLLKKDKRIVFWDNPNSLYISGQKELIMTLISKNGGSNPYEKYIDANRIYSVSLRVEENNVAEREKFFLGTVKKNLPMNLKAKTSGIYFTNNSRLGYIESAPIIFRNPSGKIDLGEPKKRLSKRIKEKIVDTLYQKPYDVALNLDSKVVQNMISLINGSNEFSKSMAINTIIHMIAEKFPAPVYVSYNSGRQFVSLNYGINHRSWM